MSLMSSKKKVAGPAVNKKVDELSKGMLEVKMNLDRNLEDVRVLKLTEIDRSKKWEAVREVIEALSKDCRQWRQDHEELRLKQKAMEEEWTKGMHEVQGVFKGMQDVYKDVQKVIAGFRKEYKTGFERIIRCEVLMNEVG